MAVWTWQRFVSSHEDGLRVYYGYRGDLTSAKGRAGARVARYGNISGGGRMGLNRRKIAYAFPRA